jgi:hypothetical protein
LLFFNGSAALGGLLRKSSKGVVVPVAGFEPATY